jgi:hypothetical protein
MNRKDETPETFPRCVPIKLTPEERAAQRRYFERLMHENDRDWLGPEAARMAEALKEAQRKEDAKDAA